MKKISGIYLITCKPEGGLPYYYVGQSIDCGRRKTEHFGELRRGSHANAKMQNVFRSHKESAFTFEVLEECAPSDLEQAEQFWLDEMVGYRRCMNAARCADAPGRGLKRSEETRERIAKAKTGLRHSEQTRKRISEVQQGKKRGPRSEETKRKIAEAQVGDKNHFFGRSGTLHHRSKPVEGVNVSTGDRIRFESANLAKISGFNPTGITACCRGEAKTYKGYSWRFISLAA